MGMREDDRARARARVTREIAGVVVREQARTMAREQAQDVMRDTRGRSCVTGPGRWRASRRRT